MGSRWDNHGLLTLICFHGDRKAISAITEIRVLSAFVLFWNGSRRLSKGLLLPLQMQLSLPHYLPLTSPPVQLLQLHCAPLHYLKATITLTKGALNNFLKRQNLNTDMRCKMLKKKPKTLQIFSCGSHKSVDFFRLLLLKGDHCKAAV